MNKKLAQKYWKENLKYLIILLSIWYTVSFRFGILLVDELNQFKIGGFKLGFWFAQQGSIYVFIILIPLSKEPQWLFAISRTNRLLKIWFSLIFI